MELTTVVSTELYIYFGGVCRVEYTREMSLNLKCRHFAVINKYVHLPEATNLKRKSVKGMKMTVFVVIHRTHQMGEKKIYGT